MRRHPSKTERKKLEAFDARYHVITMYALHDQEWEE